MNFLKKISTWKKVLNKIKFAFSIFLSDNFEKNLKIFHNQALLKLFEKYQYFSWLNRQFYNFHPFFVDFRSEFQTNSLFLLLIIEKCRKSDNLVLLRFPLIFKKMYPYSTKNSISQNLETSLIGILHFF